jgi:hypothetical protein
MKLQFLIFLLFSFSTCGQTKDEETIWRSAHRQLSFGYKSPWTLLPTIDIKEKTLTGVIDKKDGKSYIIQVTDDMPLSQIDNRTLYEAAKNKMLSAHEKNKLLAEDSVLFHGQMTHRQIYLMNTDKWGLLKQVSLMKRTGVEFISVQICFPTTEATCMTDTMPAQTLEFDKNIKILGK